MDFTKIVTDEATFIVARHEGEWVPGKFDSEETAQYAVDSMLTFDDISAVALIVISDGRIVTTKADLDSRIAAIKASIATK